MKVIHFAMAVAAAAALAAPAFATSNSKLNAQNQHSNTALNVNMGAQNSSKQDGMASVKDVSGGVLVKIALENTPSGSSEPAHIHKGTCAKLDPAPWKPLSNVVGGKSTTTVPGLTVADLKKAHYAVNVHKSTSDLKTYVSCGDL
ncbi:MAG: hypothetical protein JO322_00115 [Candidatus Eremiobacteraeota bacterium]|nr:hypothetical protein [Candidatus Eremiobacteraeota bacterium]